MSTIQPDQIDIQIGVYEALEWTQVEIAEHVGRTPQALYQRRTGAKKTFIDQIAAFVAFGVEKKLRPRLDAADVKRRLSTKAYHNLELLLERTETDENGIEKPVQDSLLLGAIKEALDRTEGKSIDRTAILKGNVNLSPPEREVEQDDLDSILAEAQEINQRRRLLTAGVPEGEVVEPVN